MPFFVGSVLIVGILVAVISNIQKSGNLITLSQLEKRTISIYIFADAAIVRFAGIMLLDRQVGL